MKIMIVDDDDDITFAVSEALRNINDSVEIMEANSAYQCLELLKQFHPEVIVLDIMMPKVNGWELSLKLKAHPLCHNVPLIYLTAIDDPNCRKLGLTLGVDYIVKPFDAKKLYDAIVKVLSKN